MPLDDKPYYLPGGAGGSTASRPPGTSRIQGRDNGQENTPRYQGTEEHLIKELDGLLHPGSGFKGFGGLDYLGTGYKPYVRPQCLPQRTLSFPGDRMSY